MSFVLRTADARDPAVLELLATHLAHSRSNAPATSCHTLPPDAMTEADVTLIGAWDTQTDALIGIGGLMPRPSPESGAPYGELKSMHVLPTARGRGIGEAVLETLIALAVERGYSHLALETGTADAYAPARRLYERVGFTECPPFAEYRVDPLSLYMARPLALPS